MKVLYICHSMNPQTGIGRLVNSVVDSLRLDQPESKFLIVTSEDLISFHHKVKFLINFRKVIDLAKSADLIHVFDTYPYGFLAVLVGILTNKPVVLTVVGTGSVKGLRSFPISFLMKYTLKKSSKITAISYFVKNEILAAWPELAIEVICPGIKTGDSENVDSHHFDNQFAGKDYILSVGSFKRRKGYDVSVRVFKKLLEKKPNLYYVIVAKPDKNNEYYSEIEKLIQDQDLIDRVIIVSNLSDGQLQAIYRGAKLFILLSRNDNQDIEGFGLVFLEAAAAGLPVIGCLGTGAEDAIWDKNNGYLVDIKDEKDIIKKADDILSNQDSAESLAFGSKSFADEMNWKNKIKDYVKIYSQFQS